MTNVFIVPMENFQYVFPPDGQKVIIYKKGKQESLEVTGIRDKEKNLFRLPPETNIDVGDVIQQKGGSIKWEVIEVDEEIQYGKKLYWEVEVKKVR